MNKRFRADVEKNLFRIPIFLDKETHDWLYNLSISMKLNGGYKLPKSYIIRSLLNALIRLKINFNNTKSEADLEKRILQSLRDFKKLKESTLNKQTNNLNRNLLITNIGMNKKQIKFIDGIAREMRFSGGKKPSRSCILNAFIKIVMSMKVDVSGVRSEKEAEERFFQAFSTKIRNRSKNGRNFISKSV